MEVILNILIGFIIMCVLIGISAIPIFIVQYYKKDCSVCLKWFLIIACMIIYILLSTTCRHFGILAARKGIPITPLIILSVLAGVNLFHAKKSIVQDNIIEQNAAKDAISAESNNTICEKKLNKKNYITIAIIIAIIITCVLLIKYKVFENKISNYWEQSYTLSRSEVLNNEIELFELKRKIPEKSYDDQIKIDGYFYNMRLIKDEEYSILFDVWQENNKVTKTRIIEDMQCIASMFLKCEEQDKIKIIIRIAPEGHVDTEDAYNGYIPSNIFNACKKIK